MTNINREKLLKEYIAQNYSDCDETDELRGKVSDSFGFNAYCLNKACEEFSNAIRSAMATHDNRPIVQKIFGYCPHCGKWFRRIRTYRQNTAYVDDDCNFFTGCKACREENDMYWEELWKDYYSSIL